ncbi:MAG: hypothetical protein J5518_02680 [Lachnospiraceae bacterium]|nr:hypothetical protein [Lachnospiraceae bacterium]
MSQKKQMILYGTAGLLFLSALLFFTALLLKYESGYESAYMDVQEEDGRYVTWREEDYYIQKGDLIFTCRDGNLQQVLVSYDGGKTYRDETGKRIDRKTNRMLFKAEKENKKTPVCFRFITQKNDRTVQTRTYRIYTDASWIISENRVDDAFHEEQNMVD